MFIERNKNSEKYELLTCPAFQVKKYEDKLEIIGGNQAAFDAFGKKSCLLGTNLSVILAGADIRILDKMNNKKIFICGKRRFMLASVNVVPRTKIYYELVFVDISCVLADKEEQQRKMLSHFAHELRNKYAVAATVLDRVYELMSSNKKCIISQQDAGETDSTPESDESSSEASMLKLNSQKKDRRILLDDMGLCIGLLREADRVIETRMQLHKIISGTYVKDANIEIVQASELIESRLRVVAGLAIGKSVRLVSDVSSCPHISENAAIRIDTFLFNHIANNLLSNAKKALDYKLQNSVIEFSLLEAQNNFLLFSIRDNGRGIPAQIKSRLFEENLSSPDCRGVGIGLASCRTFARAAGGDIWLHFTKTINSNITSDFNLVSGTEFRFRLPGQIIVAANQPNCIRASLSATHLNTLLTATPNHEASQGRHIPKTATIYIVEDSALIRKSVRAKFTAVAKKSRSSFDFIDHETVESIFPSIHFIANDPCAIITVDDNLSSCGGILCGTDLIRALVQVNFQGIIISASGCNEIANQHLKLGAHLKFGKPIFSTNKIIEALDQTFRGRRRATRTSFPWDDSSDSTANDKVIE
eukprot:CAMPEP_0197339120 /NCGR_PEP_ID=MMETSP0892-20130614/42867_1 /TAXON_ID=44058 ORGANISM="Aureoumbra lagunensis, Strain CCMP1510" /NCGR_SAMPLE_ID=MMETSP0892 /ASSEMBLY_ACC=CAM_ASM_000538 /LENGTH=588 /DNA_ID=CAMNT_0042843081 /DNA_START=119 /DNA_END=1885 /DNA_ORIENTATION=+